MSGSTGMKFIRFWIRLEKKDTCFASMWTENYKVADALVHLRNEGFLCLKEEDFGKQHKESGHIEDIYITNKTLKKLLESIDT